MPRPPLVLGTWGKISRAKRGKGWVAWARFRDFDGVTRLVERQGSTGRQAEDALVEHFRDRTRMHGAELTAESKVSVLADQWLEALDTMNLAASSRQKYRRSLQSHIMKALGGVRIREATVPVVDKFLGALEKSSGPGSAKTAKVVLSSMFSLAVRHGAAATNPVAETRNTRSEKREVRAIDIADVPLLRARLTAWDAGTDKGNHPRTTDLADVVDMLLATGVRTGEVLALRWADIDLKSDEPTVSIGGTVVEIVGTPLHRQESPKTDASNRRLRLPPFAIAMLLRRSTQTHSDWVFPSSTGTLRSPSNYRRQWRDFRQHHEYDTWITPKTFRKVVATLIRDDENLETAASQLGHSNTDVTRRFYAAKEKQGPDVASILELFGRTA